MLTLVRSHVHVGSLEVGGFRIAAMRLCRNPLDVAGVVWKL